MHDNAKFEDTYFVLRNKKSGKYATDYNFELPGGDGNDNMMLVAFWEQGYRPDAEISAGRHMGQYSGEKWKEEWDLIEVKFTEIEKTNPKEPDGTK